MLCGYISRGHGKGYNSVFYGIIIKGSFKLPFFYPKELTNDKYV